MPIQVSEFAMFSRRECIVRLLTLPGLAGLAARGAAETAAKVTKAATHYRERPNNMQMCGMCKFYIPRGGQAGSSMMGGQTGPGMMGGHMGPGMMGAGSCELVEGRISPMGWCDLYRPISG
jgi:hypothetical protein